ncbi:hypothetical protein niasHT_013026 [Heterodera trifolii]|uniref:Piwi domain-containing protein n=1 Tax=Heterodera trifolii TaxID=157864 RepID=A0ABD2L5R0_9BILA
MSHAPPQTLFERRTGKAPDIPTIVGMAYTITKHMRMLKINGTYWMLQQPRVTTASAPMVNAIKRALLAFHCQNRFFPEHIFVFRSVASEGEYKKLAQWEDGAFMTAFAEMMAEHQGMKKKPALTMVVCQRTAKYSINPTSMTEFLLIVRRITRGIAQPLRCTVVVDTAQPRVKLGELEQISYALCYQHDICSGPTAEPGVIYCAKDFSKRGRNNWRTSTADGATFQEFDYPPLGQSEEVRAQAQEQ